MNHVQHFTWSTSSLNFRELAPTSEIFRQIVFGRTLMLLQSDIHLSSLCLIPSKTIDKTTSHFLHSSQVNQLYAKGVYFCRFVTKFNQSCTKYSRKCIQQFPQDRHTWWVLWDFHKQPLPQTKFSHMSLQNPFLLLPQLFLNRTIQTTSKQ